MYCGECGKNIIDTSKFCIYCGTDVNKFRSSSEMLEPKKSLADTIDSDRLHSETKMPRSEEESIVESLPGSDRKSVQIGSETEELQSMEVRVDFYSKEEVAIKLDFARDNPGVHSETVGLFLFASYTIRQLSNLGGHDVAKMIAFLLAANRVKSISDTVEGKYIFPTSFEMHTHNLAYKIGMRMPYQVFEDMFFVSTPALVSWRGVGKYAFSMVIPSSMKHCKFSTKGFGILALNVNYCALHSIVALMTVLAREHNNDRFFHKLNLICNKCGYAYFNGGTAIGNHMPLVKNMMRELVED